MILKILNKLKLTYKAIKTLKNKVRRIIQKQKNFKFLKSILKKIIILIKFLLRLLYKFLNESQRIKIIFLIKYQTNG